MYSTNYEFNASSAKATATAPGLEATYQHQTPEVTSTDNYFQNSYNNYYNYNQFQTSSSTDSYNQQANYYPYYNQQYYYQQPYTQQVPSKVCDTTSVQQPMYNFNYTQPQKPMTPPPQYTKSFEVTPEKSVNDSGIDLISPTINQASKQMQQTSSPLSDNSEQRQQQQEFTTDSDCESDDDDARENQVPVKTDPTPNDDDVSKPPKPYLEIIADAILSTNVKMMQLHEIYQIMENKFQYFAKNINKSWRNSVRHNLSLNECFVKAGRGSNGKGNYWKIHPLCEKEFIRGNFRRKSFKQLIRAGANQNRTAAPQMPFTDYPLNYQNMPPTLPSQLVNQFSQAQMNTQFNYQFNQYQQSDSVSAYPSAKQTTSAKRYSPY